MPSVWKQGWGERRHRVDGEVCGPEHPPTPPAEGHHVGSRPLWTEGLSWRTFRVNPGGGALSARSSCFAVTLNSLYFSFQLTFLVLSITKHHFRWASTGPFDESLDFLCLRTGVDARPVAAEIHKPLRIRLAEQYLPQISTLHTLCKAI